MRVSWPTSSRQRGERRGRRRHHRPDLPQPAGGGVDASRWATTSGPKGFDDELAGLGRLPAGEPAGGLSRRDHVVLEQDGFRLLVFTVLGRSFMGLRAECPFLAADALLGRLAGRYDGALVEAHAEATSEKQALGWHLAGRVTAVLGTHTHVATADAAVLRGHTAFQCDVGMTGPHESCWTRDLPVVDADGRRGVSRSPPATCGCRRRSWTSAAAAGRRNHVEPLDELCPSSSAKWAEWLRFGQDKKIYGRGTGSWATAPSRSLVGFRRLGAGVGFAVVRSSSMSR